MCNWHGWSVWGGGDNRGPALHHWQITASIALYAPRPHPQLLRIGFVPWKFQNTENLEYSNTLLAHWARRLLVLCGHSFKLMTLGMYWAATTITHDFHTRESSIKIIQYRRRMPRQSFHVGRCCHGAVVAMRGYCLSTTDALSANLIRQLLSGALPLPQTNRQGSCSAVGSVKRLTGAIKAKPSFAAQLADELAD